MTELSLGELLDPHPPIARDIPKWIAEGHKRLATPLTALSYALVALLVGAQRHVPPAWQLRPAAGRRRRDGGAAGVRACAWKIWRRATTRCCPLIWLQAVVPGVICGWLLLGPQMAAMRAASAAEADLSA